jgi:hypothetical protein
VGSVFDVYEVCFNLFISTGPEIWILHKIINVFSLEYTVWNCFKVCVYNSKIYTWYELFLCVLL